MSYSIIGVVLVACMADAPSPDPEASALAQRLSIRTMNIRYTATERTSRDGGAAITESALSRIWYDRNGDKLRVERTLLGSQPGPEFVRVRNLGCQNCERAGWGILATDDKGLANKFGPMGPVRGALKSGQSLRLCDPTMFGYSVLPYTLTDATTRLDSFVGAAGRKDVRSSRDVIDGIECVKIQSVDMIGRTNAVWVAPSLGYTVIRAMVTTKLENGLVVNSVVKSTGVRPVGNSGLYYPTKIVWETTDSDGKVRPGDTLDVESITINDPIPASVFSLAGLGLPDGSYLSAHPRNLAGFIYGGKLRKNRVPETADTAPQEPLPPPVPVDAAGQPINAGSGLWLYASTLLALSAVAFGVYWRLSAKARNIPKV